MRIADVSHWGFLLEHEGMPFFVPFVQKGPMTMQHQVKFSDEFGVVIKTGDLPFFVDNNKECHFFTKESNYGQMVMKVMVDYAIRNRR